LTHFKVGEFVQLNDLEDLNDYLREDNQRLRDAAGEGPPPLQPFPEWQRHRKNRVAQAEALNTHLEDRIDELEGQVKKMNESQKLCARYHGKCATK
jgi:hypothetical protein